MTHGMTPVPSDLGLRAAFVLHALHRGQALVIGDQIHLGHDTAAKALLTRRFA